MNLTFTKKKLCKSILLIYLMNKIEDDVKNPKYRITCIECNHKIIKCTLQNTFVC